MELELKLAIGNDLAGYDFKVEMVRRLQDKGYTVTDFGSQSSREGDYPVIAEKVARSVVSGEHDRGILICGTGQGICMSANKVKGARAALCYEPFTAIMSREHNNANIIATGCWIVTPDEFERILEVWLFAKYATGRHDARIAAIAAIESR